MKSILWRARSDIKRSSDKAARTIVVQTPDTRDCASNTLPACTAWFALDVALGWLQRCGSESGPHLTSKRGSEACIWLQTGQSLRLASGFRHGLGALVWSSWHGLWWGPYLDSDMALAETRVRPMGSGPDLGSRLTNGTQPKCRPAFWTRGWISSAFWVRHDRLACILLWLCLRWFLTTYNKLERG